MARKRRESSSSGGGDGANWMDTYGDMVTLLLTFFVLLFSMSTIDAAKWKSLVGAFSGSQSVAIDVLTPEMAMQRPIELIVRAQDQTSDLENPNGYPAPPNMGEDEETAYREWYNFLELVEALNNYVSEHELVVEVNVDYDAYIVTMHVEDYVFFDSGSANIKPDAIETLDHIANMMRSYQHYVLMLRIEGHTDNVPINTFQYPSNWELSTSRAVSVLRYIIGSDVVDRTKVTASGYGEEHPIETNETPEGRAANRRVDFVFEGIKTR